MKTTNLSKLDINELTQDQYDKLVDSGEVDENALYFVPTEEKIASLTEYGITILEDSVTSTSIESAATPNSVKTAYDLADSKQDKAQIVSYTLTASGWSSSVYSFESSYPVSKYDLQVEPNGDSITSDQLDAWVAAQPVGSATANQIKAMGDTPTVSIPVILKAVEK